MFILGLDSIPAVTIQAWLKRMNLPHSGNHLVRLQQLLDVKKITEIDLLNLVEEYKNHGRKHVRIYKLTHSDWERLKSPSHINKMWETRIKDENNILNLLGMSFDKLEIIHRRFFIRVSKTVSEPYVDESTRIKIKGIEYVAIRHKDVLVGIVFVADFSTNTIEIRYDSLSEMGREKKRVFQQGEQVLTDWLDPNKLNTLRLMTLAENIEASEVASISDVIAKYETENKSGKVVSGTVRYSRESSGKVSATELPGGENLLDSKSDDHYVDKYSVLWSKDDSDGILTRDIRTEIYTVTGEIYFPAHMLKNEMEYVLSRIRKLTT